MLRATLLGRTTWGFCNALRELGVRYISVASGPGEGGWVSLDLLDPFHEVKGGGARVFDSVIDLVSGNLPTPLVKLGSLSREWCESVG